VGFAMFMVSFISRAILLAFFIFLSACGEGEGDDTNTSGNPNNSDPNSNSSTSLSRPTISTSQIEDSIVVFWDQSNASHYRVIYWEENQIPQEYLTSDFEHTSPPLTLSSEYTIIVEAYDEFGNSLFSEPSTIEVI
jgi:hypothetical protein